MSAGLPFILISALAAGLWFFLVAQAARQVSPLFGPAIAELTGALIAITLIFSRLRSGTLELTSKGVVLLLIAGVCVFSVDYFSLRAYGKGLPITVGAPILTGGAIAVATTVGLLLGEPISLKKGVGIPLPAE